MSNLFKYPHTVHLPQSRTRTDDDHVLKYTDHLHGMHVVITTKMDGENTTLYRDHYHARSLDSRHHSSRDWIKAYHATIKADIPENWRICGENLYAQHSIRYDDLPSYFMGFSVWNEFNACLDWYTTLEWFEILGITPVPILYKGMYSDKIVDDIIAGLDITKQEGFVIRNTQSFLYDDFGMNVAKWVRPAHVTTQDHWMHSEIKANGLKND